MNISIEADSALDVDEPLSRRGHRPRFIAPCQLRDLTFVAVGATFRRAAILAQLPPNLRASEANSGGFLVALVREGFRLAPFSTGHVWFDVQDHDGSSGSCRFLPRPFQQPPGNGQARGIRAGHCRASIREGAEEVSAMLELGQTAAFRITLRPGWSWTSNAGIDHSISCGGPGKPATRLNVTPWAGDWSDATPLAVDVPTGEWADLAPQELTWAAVGKQAAMTLGLSLRLDG